MKKMFDKQKDNISRFRATSEKCEAVFGKRLRKNKGLEQTGDSTESHSALVPSFEVNGVYEFLISLKNLAGVFQII